MKCATSVKILLSFTISLHTAKTFATVVKGPYPNGVPGSGYGCDNQCNSGDVNYVIHAKLENYPIPGSQASELGKGQELSMFTRTFEGDSELSSPFCQGGYNGTSGPLGPCITVNPGQTMSIKIINDMKDGMDFLKQHKALLSEYWQMAQDPADNLDNITWFGTAPKTPEEMKIINEQDLPGYDATFDDVNLHIHGMQVVPHLFYPQGTGEATAPWITIQPSNENPDQQCHCYVFEIPEDNPQGDFFYHIHRHGSVAMQAWQGMFGYLQVGNSTNPGAPEHELQNQGIRRSEPFVLWEWAIDTTHTFDVANVTNTSGTVGNGGNKNTYIEGQFLGDMEQVFLTNNDYQPTYEMAVNETVHFKLLCAQATTGSVIFVLDGNDDGVPFWVFAADAISYDKAYQKDSVVVGPGQREAILLQFNKPGTYRIMQIIINDFQNTGELDDLGDDNYFPAATITVQSGDAIDPVDLSSLTFTHGMTHTIEPGEVVQQISVNFVVHSELDKAPVPQFAIDGKLFDYRNISHTVQATTAQQWTLTSNMNYFHPFHIHVNPFQVKDVYTGNVPGILPTGQTLEDALKETVLEPANQYRDTIFIPPFGMVVINQKFGSSSVAWAGKTVYHCHFLDHEDQGMIAAMMIGDPNEGETGSNRRNLRSNLLSR